MPWAERYANFDLTTGANDGTSEVNAWQSISSMLAGCASGQRVNIKKQSVPNATITSTTTFGPSVAATALSPICFRGYSSTPGDGGIAKIILTTPSAFTCTFGVWVICEGLEFSLEDNGPFLNATNSTIFNRCRFIKLGYGDVNFSVIKATNCYFEFSNGNGSVHLGGTNSDNSWLINSKIVRTNTSVKEMLYSDSINKHTIISNCVFVQKANFRHIFLDRATGNGGHIIDRCKFYGGTDCIEIDEQPSAVRAWIHVFHNVFSTMSGYGVKTNTSRAGFVKLQDNFYYDVDAGLTNYDELDVVNSNFQLTQDPFVDANTYDLRLNNLPDGGSVCRNSGVDISEPYDYVNMKYIRTSDGGVPLIGHGGLVY